MIRIFLGNIGSGKTSSCVREMFLNPSDKTTYSNIKTDMIKNNILISHDMIIKKEILSTKKNGEEVSKLTLNKEFWQKVIEKEGSINVVLDEAHSIIDSRKSMSKVNAVMADFMALLRRILGSNDAGYGTLTLISQIPRRLDVVAREMAVNIRYHICHYKKLCKRCGLSWRETNEVPEPRFRCPRCKTSSIKKMKHYIEVFHFANMDYFEQWFYLHKHTYHKRYLIPDIERYFKFYDTLQWDNLICEV